MRQPNDSVCEHDQDAKKIAEVSARMLRSGDPIYVNEEAARTAQKIMILFYVDVESTIVKIDTEVRKVIITKINQLAECSYILLHCDVNTCFDDTEEPIKVEIARFISNMVVPQTNRVSLRTVLKNRIKISDENLDKAIAFQRSVADYTDIISKCLEDRPYEIILESMLNVIHDQGAVGAWQFRYGEMLPMPLYVKKGVRRNGRPNFEYNINDSPTFGFKHLRSDLLRTAEELHVPIVIQYSEEN